MAWINASPRGAVHAHDSLRLVLRYAHADVVVGACAEVPVTSAMVGDDSLISDSSVRAQLAEAADRLAAHILSRRS